MFQFGGVRDILLLATLLSIVHELSANFNLEAHCAARCLKGQGGILCNCNAVHFNGKRSNSGAHGGPTIQSRNHDPLETPSVDADEEGASSYTGQGDRQSPILLETKTWNIRGGSAVLPLVLFDRPENPISKEENEQALWPESSRDTASQDVDDAEMNDSRGEVNKVIRLRHALLQAMQGR